MISQLIENIKKTKAPICVGLDPMLSYVPEHVVKKAFDAYGETWREQQKQFGSLIKRSSTLLTT